jgi:HEAT repeat protein
MFSFAVRVIACGLCASLGSYGWQSDSDYDSKQRIQKIRDLGGRGSEAIPTIAQYLGDRNRDIRVEAVKAIVKIDGEASLNPLTKALQDNDQEVQIRATDGLVNYYLPGYVARGALSGPVTRGFRQVKGFFSKRNDEVIGQEKEVREEVGQSLGKVINGGSSKESRANAALAAGILRARPAVPALTQALHAKENELIFESLVALQKIHDPSAGPAVSFLARDFDDRIQITALETIGVLRSLDSAPDVRAALSGSRNQKTRRAALECLAMLGLPGDRKIFQGYLIDRDVELRASALEGLGRIREPEDNPVLERAYNEQNADWRIHIAAAFGLVSEGRSDIKEFSPLRYLFEGLGTKARANTAQAYLIEVARREDVRSELVKLLPDASKDQKLGLCSVFAETKSQDIVPALTTLTKDIDPDVAFAATRALRIVQTRRSS